MRSTEMGAALGSFAQQFLGGEHADRPSRRPRVRGALLVAVRAGDERQIALRQLRFVHPLRRIAQMIATRRSVSWSAALWPCQMTTCASSRTRLPTSASWLSNSASKSMVWLGEHVVPEGGARLRRLVDAVERADREIVLQRDHAIVAIRSAQGRRAVCRRRDRRW